MNATPSCGSMTKTLVAKASASIVEGATMETLTFCVGDLPVREFTM
jgi:hypothetical protein